MSAPSVVASASTRRERWSWYLYDFGNSAYASVVILAVYSAYFKTTVVGGAEGSRLWGLAIGVAMLAVALMSPVLGVIADYTPSENNRVVCYCDDCQAFARWLGRDDLLDPHGGSDIVQVAPSRLRFTQGADQLRCMRLSGKGIHRWYAACCRQPAGNTLPSARSPFVGLVSAIVERPEGRALDDVIGPSFGGIHGRLATGGRPPGVPDRVSFKILWRSVRPLLANLVAGRHRPSPFVDPATGGFVSPPQVLSTAERDALRPR